VSRSAKTARTQGGPGFILAAVFCLFPALFSGVAAEQVASPFSGTTWISIGEGPTSTIVFAPDGTWTEHWKKRHPGGHWQANKDNTEVIVTRSDNVIIHYKLNAQKNLVREDLSTVIYQPSSSAPNPIPIKSFASPLQPTAPPANLTLDQARAVVLVKGDNAQGTGFLIKTTNGPVVFTNIHVISNNPNLKITTNTGLPITILSYQGATDRDLAMITVKNGAFSYLTLASDVSGAVQPGDEVITPGNSEGGGVILNTDGKVMGIGPDRIEFDNPIYHGNSGGPIFHVKSGTVIGVVTEAIKVDVSDEIDKTSFASPNSAIRNSLRYFGLRLDTVPKWELYDWKRLQTETAFIDQFDERSCCLDSYLNAPATHETTPEKKKHEKKKPEKKEPPAQGTQLWLTDPQIVDASNRCLDEISRAGTSQPKRMVAIRKLLADLENLANSDMASIQNPANFYTFDQQRTPSEVTYRKAILAELAAIGNNVSRMGGFVRNSK
jgi:S1-C subfamily serine protease